MKSGPGEISPSQLSQHRTTMIHIQLLLESGHCEAAQAIIQWHLARLGHSDKEVLE
jgi:hypothetical protein